MQEKNMGHICPIGRSGIKVAYYILHITVYNYHVLNTNVSYALYNIPIGVK